MRAVLHPYQEQCVSWLESHDEGALLLDMGMGKTLIALTAIADLMALGEVPGKVLVIAPLATARHVWAQEAAKWDHTSHLRVSLALGSAKARDAAVCRSCDIVVVNRENVPWLVRTFGRAWPFPTVVVDELSSFKNRQAKRWRALKSVRPRISRLWGLTGTPAPNGLMDLWAQMYLVDRGASLGPTIGGYRDLYFRPGRRNGAVVYDWLLRDGADEAIFGAIAPHAVSMRASDGLDLPGRVDNVVEVELPDDAMEAYRSFERDQVADLAAGEVTAASAGIVAGKLLQFADGAVYTDAGGGEWAEVHKAKLEALAQLADEAQGQPVLVFYAFRHDRERILDAFPQAEAFDPDGDAAERWNEGSIPMLVAHPASCGHGLNLQGGGHIAVWFGLTWNLEHYQQANARLDRQGQTETVIVHHLAAAGTADARVLEVLAGKRTIQDAVLASLRPDGGEPR